MLNLLKSKIAPVVVASGLALAGFGLTANATTILAFGQSGSANTVFAVQTTSNCTGTGTNATCHTDIDAVNVPVTVTSYFGAGVTPFAAFFTLDSQSVGFGSTVPITFQPFSGTFCIASGAGCSGTRYLYGDFTDLVFGSGPGLVMAAVQPGGTINFFSDLIGPADLLPPSAIGLAFTNVTPLAGLCPALPSVHQTYCSFSANVAGTYSATTTLKVPEPDSLALLGLGLAALGLMRRRRT